MWKLNQERSRRIPWVARPLLCPACRRALEPETTQCTCGETEPDEGWPTVQDADDPWLGRALADHYVIVQKVGAGVFGTVYRASTLHASSEYAIKLVDLSRIEFVDDERALERIHREVRLLAKVRSPHVVKFHDVLELPDSVVGVVTSFVDGVTLTELMARDGRFDIDRTCELGRQVAIGMSEIHRLGAVHRDLKPDNLMVQQLGRGQEFIHVIDFGISLFEGGGDTEGFWGTPLYASPEQALGDPLTPASDIYSLGTCLWEMLIGEAPFPGKNLASVLDAHIDKALPDPVAERPELREYPSLIALLRQMMAKNPADRPQHMQTVADQLAEIAWGYNPADDRAHQNAPSSPDDSVLSALSYESDRPNRFPTSPFFDVDLLGHLLMSVSPDGLCARVTAANEVRTVKMGGDSPFPAKSTSLLPVNSVWVGDSSNGVIMTGHRDGTVRRWVPRSRPVTIHRDTRLAPVTAVAEGETGRIHAAGSASGRISAAADTRTDAIAETHPGAWGRLPSGKPVTSLAVNDRLETIAVGRSDGEIEIFQHLHGVWEKVSSMFANGTPVDVRFSSDAYLVSVCLQEGRREIFSVADGRQVQARRICRVRAAFSFGHKQPPPCGEDCEVIPESASVECLYLPAAE